jgi:hypothetical protein
MGSAEVILFAIQSAIKLGQAARQAYVDSTASAALALPLPDFNANINVQVAINYFTLMAPAKWPTGAAAVMNKNTAGTALSDAEQALLIKIYLEQRLIDEAALKLIVNPDGTFFTPDSIQAMVSIRQWGRDPNPSAVQRVAGTLFQIGVDYYATTPGALNENSAQGSALKALLGSLDQIDFATVDVKDLLPRLFTSTIETLAQHPDALSRNKNTDALISSTATALATNVQKRLQDSQTANGANLPIEKSIVSWGDVVYRSVLQGAGEAIAKDPKTFLGTKNAGDTALIGNVGEAMIGFLLDGHSGESVSQIGTDALNSVLKSALSAISSHPDLVLRTQNAGLKNLLSQTAKTLSGYSSLLTPKIVPDITCSLLEGTAANLELIWPHGSTDPADHLLLTAADSVLKVLTTRTSADQWRPSFSADDAVAVVNSVFHELIGNPGWLVSRAGKLNPALSDVLSSVLSVLRAKADSRLSPATALTILETAVSASGIQAKLLNRLPPTDQPMVAGAIQAVITPLFDPGLAASAAGTLIRDDVIQAMCGVAVSKLSATDLAPGRLTQLTAAIQAEVTLVVGGKAWDPLAFATAVTNALAAP